ARLYLRLDREAKGGDAHAFEHRLRGDIDHNLSREHAGRRHPERASAFIRLWPVPDSDGIQDGSDGDPGALVCISGCLPGPAREGKGHGIPDRADDFGVAVADESGSVGFLPAPIYHQHRSSSSGESYFQTSQAVSTRKDLFHVWANGMQASFISSA